MLEVDKNVFYKFKKATRFYHLFVLFTGRELFLMGTYRLDNKYKTLFG